MKCPTTVSLRTTAWQLLKQDWWLEYALILSIFMLLVQILGPTLLAWWHLPRPGRLGLDSLPKEFYEGNPARAISPGYACVLPTNYNTARTWPVLVFLHGSGERGNDPQTLIPWSEFLSGSVPQEFPAIVLVPQCVSQQIWRPADVADFVKTACQRYQIDRDRIYLMGFSMGGYGTWATACEYPQWFAAIVPISGGHNSKEVSALMGIPIWAFHGAKDEVVPVEQTKDVVEALQALGEKPKLTVYPEAGHGITRRVCERSDLWHWLLEQRLSARSGSEQKESVSAAEILN